MSNDEEWIESIFNTMNDDFILKHLQIMRNLKNSKFSNVIL